MEHATPAALILIFFFIAPVLYYIRRVVRGQQIHIRRIPGVDAIDEAVGRSVELGRSISFTSGLAGVGPLLYACLGILHHIARKAAVFGSKLLVPCADPEVLVLSDATVQSAYRVERRFSRYEPTTVRFLSSEQFAYAAGYMGLIHREGVGSAFLLGSFAAESLVLAEAGQQVGAIQVAGTTSYEQIPFFIASCDYTLIGEELYAASALLSKNPVQQGSLRGQDLGKAFIALLILLGIVQATLGAFGVELPLTSWLDLTWGSLGGRVP
jgi:hypothetical protein